MVITALGYLMGNRYFWYGFSVILGILLISKLVKFYNKEKPGFLSSSIKVERKKLCKRRKLDTLKNWCKQIYFPSWSSFFIVFIIIITPFIFIFILQKLNKFPSMLLFDRYYSQNLVAILAGTSIIIFALIIFIAQSLREEETTDRARVLLRECFLYPLAVAIILIFFTFIWANVNIWNLMLILAIGIFTIISLSRLILVLLNKYRFFKKRLELLKDRIKRSIELAIDERIGNNILSKKLEENKI